MFFATFDPYFFTILKQHQALSSDGGFISNDLRQVIWPKLLGFNRFELRPPFQNYVARNQWSDQISRDVARSLWHYRLPQAKKRKRGGRRRLLADVREKQINVVGRRLDQT